MQKRKNKKRVNKINRKVIYILILLIMIITSYYMEKNTEEIIDNKYENIKIDLSDIPDYNGKPYIEINGNVPNFSEDDYNIEPDEQYGNLDKLGRCTTAFAKVSIKTMPKKSRKSISSVKPTGWHAVRYDIVEGKYLYNRCHLIGYQLTSENANEKNLITGTRYMNVEGMLPFENQVAEYVKETENHVLYRVTPIFKDKNLIASGVNIEAISIEDEGKGICFNVYIYNVQPGVKIDYLTGKSSLEK